MGETIKFEIKSVTLNQKVHNQKGKIITSRFVLENIHIIGTQQHNGDFFKGAIKDITGENVGANAKFMFIHQALRRVILNPEHKHTILLCSQGYSAKQKKIAIDRFLELKCNVWEIDSIQQAINYINTKNPDDVSEIKAKRLVEKVERVFIYSHGIVNKILLGMGQYSEGDGKYQFTKDIAKKINSLAFTTGSKFYCFSCRTGLGNPEIFDSIYKSKIKNSTSNGTSSMGVPISNDTYETVALPLYSAQSLAQAIANSSKIDTFAYLCRSDYEDTLNTPDELDFHDAYRAGVFGEKRKRKNYSTLAKNGKPTEDEKARYKELEIRIKRRVPVDKMCFDPQGASHPIKGGTTPIGLPQDMKTFKSI